MRLIRHLTLAALATCVAAAAVAAPITLEIDARDVTQGIQHVHLVIPAHPGPLTLGYPKWIPGEHAADGPITQVVSLVISAGEHRLPWRRGTLDPFLFHLEVPKGGDSVDVRFDYLSPPKAFGDGYGQTPNVTPHLVLLPFNHFVLYPAEASADAVEVRTAVRLPPGWKYDGALHPERVEDDTLFLPEVSLYTLIDSPIFAGEYFRSIPLTDGSGTRRVSLVADSPADLALSDATITAFRHLVPEAVALFGPGHYREYVWLIAQSNNIDQENGLEHHESTDIRDHEGIFTKPFRLLEHRTSAHEYVHTWNGKYRRPAGLATRNRSGREDLTEQVGLVLEHLRSSSCGRDSTRPRSPSNRTACDLPHFTAADVGACTTAVREARECRWGGFRDRAVMQRSQANLLRSPLMSRPGAALRDGETVSHDTSHKTTAT